MNVFFDTNHSLRPGWKFIIYLAFFFLFWFVFGTALATVVAVMTDGSPPDDQLTVFALNGVALAFPAVLAMLFTVRFIDRRPLKIFGVGFLPQWQRHLGAGLALAAAMLAVLIAGCFAFGYVRIGWTGRQVPLQTLAGTLGVLLLAAANEELVFRGFPLQILIESFGKWPGIVFMSVLFGLLHLKNPNSSIPSTANTILAGILLSLAYVRTRSLWFPYGIHIGWNVGLGFILGFHLSGVDLASIWTTGISGRDTILGGDYGPEGGLLATFIFASSAVMVQNWGREPKGIRSKSK